MAKGLLLMLLKLLAAAAAGLVLVDLVVMPDAPLEWGFTRFRRELRTFLDTPTRTRALIGVGDEVQWTALASAHPAVAARLEGHLEEARGGQTADTEVVFVFLRHIGCPVASATIAAAFPAARSRADVQFVVVAAASVGEAQQFADQATKTAAVAQDNVQLVGDPEHELYEVFGVPVTGWDHIMAPEVLAGMDGLAAEGHSNSMPAATGSRFQSAAAFLVRLSQPGGGGGNAKATVRAVHLPAHALELPDFPTLLAGRSQTPRREPNAEL